MKEIQAIIVSNPLELIIFDSEERVRDCLNEFFLMIGKPETSSVFDLSYFYGPKQTELTAVQQLILDAYHAFVRSMKSQNVFYLVPYQTLNLLYPVQPSE